jgi:hypothetical protein
MNLAENLKTSIGERVLSDKLKNRKREPVFCNINSAMHIGVIYDATEYVSFEIVKDLVKRLTYDSRIITVLGYVHNKKLIDQYLYRKGFDFFSRNDLNWYYKPVSPVAMQFMNEPFDLLINLSLRDYYPVQYITALSPASFKAGRYSPDELYLDLMIDIEKERQSMRSLHQDNLGKDDRQIVGDESEATIINRTQTELELNFLINQLLHYLSLLNK